MDIGQAWSRNGEWRCPSQETVGDKPCINVDRKVESDDHVGRINLNYKVTDDVLLYATWSEGFRPGGINRNPFVGDYEPDFLTNWELGWKTQWAGSVQFNGAVFFLSSGTTCSVPSPARTASLRWTTRRARRSRASRRSCCGR